MSGLLLVAAIPAAIGSALLGGVFLPFSSFVMRALDGRPTVEAIATMQAINRAVLNPLFMTLFLGTPALCALILGLVLLGHGRSAAGWLAAGALLHLAGCQLVTISRNVPLNERLARGQITQWASYRGPWLAWNHLRTVACLLSAACLTLAIRTGP